MPANDLYDNPHSLTIRTDAIMYGCHNKPRPKEGDPIYTGIDTSIIKLIFNFVKKIFPRLSKRLKEPETYMESFPYLMSIECRYDRSLTDIRCTNCEHQGSGELYSEMINNKVKANLYKELVNSLTDEDIMVLVSVIEGPKQFLIKDKCFIESIVKLVKLKLIVQINTNSYIFTDLGKEIYLLKFNASTIMEAKANRLATKTKVSKKK